jgi:hypothetical protein
MAAAHPTPLSTAIAPSLQFNRQAPHSIQATGLSKWAFLFIMVNTAWGQTMVHSRHPLHNSGLYVSVFT